MDVPELVAALAAADEQLVLARSKLLAAKGDEHTQLALASLLFDATMDGDGAAVAGLLARGADPNTPSCGGVGSTPATMLVVAAANDHLDVARLLLDGGADPNRADSDGGTPLMAGVRTGSLAMLRLLLERGAAVDAVNPESSETAFHAACICNHRGEKEIGVQGAHFNPLGLFLRTSIPFIWYIMSAFLPA
jgi:ankyrin repeat protein